MHTSNVSALDLSSHSLCHFALEKSTVSPQRFAHFALIFLGLHSSLHPSFLTSSAAASSFEASTAGKRGQCSSWHFFVLARFPCSWTYTFWRFSTCSMHSLPHFSVQPAWHCLVALAFSTPHVSFICWTFVSC